MIQFVSGNIEQATELMLFNSVEILLKLELYLKNIYKYVQIHRSNTNTNTNVEHDIITRDAYSVSWAEIWEFSKSQRDIINAVTI